MARTKYTVTFPAAKAGDEVTWPNSVKVYADANIDRPLGNGYIETAAGSFTGWSDAASVTFTRHDKDGTTDAVTVTSGSPTGTGAAVPSAASGATGVVEGTLILADSSPACSVPLTVAEQADHTNYGASVATITAASHIADAGAVSVALSRYGTAVDPSAELVATEGAGAGLALYITLTIKRLDADVYYSAQTSGIPLPADGAAVDLSGKWTEGATNGAHGVTINPDGTFAVTPGAAHEYSVSLRVQVDLNFG